MDSYFGYALFNYGRFHHNKTNIAIHVVGVPSIVITLIYLLDVYAYYECEVPFDLPFDLGNKMNYVTLIYMGSVSLAYFTFDLFTALVAITS